MITVRLFGPFDVTVDDQPLTRTRSQAGRHLLALLTLRRQTPVERSALAALLWPDSDEERANFYLRRTLTELRQALGSEAERLQSPTSRSLRLALENCDCDLVHMDAAVKSGQSAEIVRLYRGPLLESYSEEWIIGPRAYYAEQYLTALMHLAESLETNGDIGRAIPYLRQIIRTDPTRETAQRSLMRLLSLSGDTASALQVYRDLRLYLMREGLGTPSAETEAVHQAVRQGTYRNSPLLARSMNPPSPPDVASAPVHHLPQPLTRLVGRDTELAEIVGHLNEGRLVTITGNGGAGKTRLAIEVADSLKSRFRDGVHFVDLSALQDPVLLPQTVVQSLEIAVPTGTTPLGALQQNLKQRQILLVLDNCEQLIDSIAELVMTLLAAGPGVSIVATSRQSLGIVGERVFRLPALSLAAAVTLFLERSLAHHPQGLIQSDIGQVCQLLEGVPLAIELAAAWTAYLPLTEITTNLQDRLFTASTVRGLPARHRTIRATLDWGYQLLTQEERTLFAQLSLFSGGWTWETARTVIGASPAVLATLVDKSLVVFDGNRYSFLETVRQYATEHLDEKERERLQLRLIDWCLEFAGETVRHLSGQDQLHYLALFDREQDNLRTGLEASRQCSPQKGLRIATSLASYWKIRGNVTEGVGYFDTLLAADTEPTGRHRVPALREALTLHTMIGNYTTSIAMLTEASTLCHAAGDTRGEAELLRFRANVTHHQGQYALSLKLYEEALPLQRELGDREGELNCLENMGYLARRQGNFEQSARLLLEVIALYQSMGNALGEVSAIGSLAYTRLFQGKVTTAASLFEKALTIHRAAGNPGGIGWNLAGLSEVMVAVGDHERAKKLLEESLAIHLEMGKRGSEAWNREHLARLAVRMGDRAEALRQFYLALDIYRSIGNDNTVKSLEGELNALIASAGAH